MLNKEDKLIKIAIEEGNEIFFNIIDQHPPLDEEDPRQTVMLLSILTNCMVHLHLHGWSERELVNEVFDHCKLAREIINGEEE
jgi:hypothetical protein